MKLTLLYTTLTLSVASAHKLHHGRQATSPDEWAPPGENDLRGPCPMMNTLANHGFLPHDGTGITLEVAVAGLGAGLNFNESLVNIMFQQAIIANPEPNATSFTLGQLNVHNLLEHDASLSRSDAFFGNNHLFNQTIFDTTRAYWTDENVTAAMLANSKVARQLASKAFNPEYAFTTTTEQFSLGEVIAPIVAFGDLDSATVNRTLMEYLFQNERLPTELGWTKKTKSIELADIGKLTEIMSNATTLLTGPGAVPATRRRGLHGDFFV